MTITHISYSSVQLFLKNPLAWHAKYVLGIRDQKTNPGALVGTAFHEYCEMRLKGIAKEVCMEGAKQVIDTCMDVDWGKTGSVEKALEELESLVIYFEREKPTELRFLEGVKILGVEARVECKPRGFKLPVKSFIDLVFKGKDGELYLLDWKTKKAYDEKITPSHKLQAAVYYYQAEVEYRQKPKAMVFVEIKASKNKDGTPQIKPLIYNYEENQKELKALKYLINKSVTKMTSKRQDFLPNIQDEYEGETSLDRFIANYYVG